MIWSRQFACRATALAYVTAFVAYALGVSGESITPRWTGDELRIAAPKLHFLTGKPLERLRNGASIPFDFQLTVWPANHNAAMARALERFVISYDLWEEKFSVVRVRNSRRSGSHLSAAAAEAWCLENLAIPSSDLAPDTPIWLKLEVRSGDPRSLTASASTESGISLSNLIEVFSRPTRGAQDHWQMEAGPFKLSDVRIIERR